MALLQFHSYFIQLNTKPKYQLDCNGSCGILLIIIIRATAHPIWFFCWFGDTESPGIFSHCRSCARVLIISPAIFPVEEHRDVLHCSKSILWCKHLGIFFHIQKVQVYLIFQPPFDIMRISGGVANLLRNRRHLLVLHLAFSGQARSGAGRDRWCGT